MTVDVVAKPLVLSEIWENEDGPRRCANTTEGLTHSSGISREGLGMKPTREVPSAKQCARCEGVLSLESFKEDSRMRLGRSSYCRECSATYARERYAANLERSRAISRAAEAKRRTPERTRARHLKAMYGLTVEQYDRLLLEQDGRCAICHTDAPGGRGNWHVDHCHDSGKVRALLCAGCNVGIGQLAHNPDRLRAAAFYIESHQEQA